MVSETLVSTVRVAIARALSRFDQEKRLIEFYWR